MGMPDWADFAESIDNTYDTIQACVVMHPEDMQNHVEGCPEWTPPKSHKQVERELEVICGHIMEVRFTNHGSMLFRCELQKGHPGNYHEQITKVET